MTSVPAAIRAARTIRPPAQRAAAPPALLRLGTVAAVNATSPPTVEVDGFTMSVFAGVEFLAVDDVVVYAREGATGVVLGRLADSLGDPRPASVAWRNTSTSTLGTSGTWGTVAFAGGDVVSDPLGMADAGNEWVSIPAGFEGSWMAYGQVTFAANGTGARGVRLTVPSVVSYNLAVVGNAGGAVQSIVPFALRLPTLTAGADLRLEAIQYSGGSLNVVGASLCLEHRSA